MTNELSIASAPITTDAQAREHLDLLMGLIGVDGLVAALALPNLGAEVDQHASAVRESLAAAGRAVVPLALAGYSRSVLAAHERHGRPLPDPATIDWIAPEWTVLRLLGVCWLAEQTGAL